MEYQDRKEDGELDGRHVEMPVSVWSVMKAEIAIADAVNRLRALTEEDAELPEDGAR